MIRLCLPTVLLLAASSATAQTLVDVKARAWLAELRTMADGRRITVVGVLRDNLNQPVASADIDLGVKDRRHRVTTGPDGGFSGRIVAPTDGDQEVEIGFAGNSLLSPAQAVAQVTVGRTEVRIAGLLPNQIPAFRQRSVAVHVTNGQGQPIPSLPLIAARDDGPPEQLQTDAGGRATYLLPILGVGEHTLRIIWVGDEMRRPAMWERRLHASAQLEVLLEYAGKSPAAPGALLAFDGELRNGPGADVAVVLVANGAPAARTTTAKEGRFRFTIEADDLPLEHRSDNAAPRLVAFRALSDARDEAFRDGVSNQVELLVTPPPPPSPLWTWAPIGLACVAVLGAAIRRRPKRVRPTKVSPAATALPPSFELFIPPNARGRKNGVLHVEVSDLLTGALLDAQIVALQAGSPAPDPARLDPPPGQRIPAVLGEASVQGPATAIWVGSRGYAPELHSCRIPPGGHARIRLLPVRARIQHIYRDVIEGASRPRLRFGHDTPRECAWVLTRRGASNEAVAHLTDLVEAACFGPNEPDGDALAQAHRLARTVSAALR